MSVDPRWELAFRLIVPRKLKPPLLHIANDLVWEPEGAHRLYDYFRLLHNVPEGPMEMVPGKAICLESNYQYLAGVDFDKGCYLGQELVARTFHTGDLRKSLFTLRRLYPYASNHDLIQSDPLVLVPNLLHEGVAEVEDVAASLIGKPIMAASGAQSGVVLGGSFDLVTGLLRHEHLQEKNLFSINSKGQETEDWQALVPPWWRIQADSQET